MRSVPRRQSTNATLRQLSGSWTLRAVVPVLGKPEHRDELGRRRTELADRGAGRALGSGVGRTVSRARRAPRTTRCVSQGNHYAGPRTRTPQPIRQRRLAARTGPVAAPTLQGQPVSGPATSKHVGSSVPNAARDERQSCDVQAVAAPRLPVDATGCVGLAAGGPHILGAEHNAMTIAVREVLPP